MVDSECCRISTSFRNKPHVVPFSYVSIDGCFYIATDIESKNLHNIKNNPFFSLVVDTYTVPKHKEIVISGIVKPLEWGELFKKVFTMFFNKFEWVKKNLWVKCEAPFLRIYPDSKARWGLKKYEF